MAEIVRPPNRILRLDQSNRFGRSVVFASLPGQMPGTDIRTQQDPVVTSPTYGFGPYGASVLYSSTGGSVFSGLKPIPKTQDGFTSVVIAAPSAQARMNALLFLGDESGSPFIQSTFAANYDTSIDGVRSGYLSYFEYTGVFSAKRACAPGVIDGQPHVFILVRNPGATAPDIYIDGVASTGASTVGGTVSLPSGVGVGSTNKPSNARSCAGPLYLAYVLDRAIDVSDVIELTRNPAQIFDTEQRIWVGVAGAGTPRTSTAGLDAAVRRSVLALSGFDAAVQRTASAGAGADAAVQIAWGMLAALDAAVQTARSAQAALAAVIQQPRTGSAGLDAAVRQAATAQAGLDAAVQRTSSAGAGADAAVQTAQVMQAALDTAIRRAASVAAGLDAYIAAGGGSFALASLDAAIRAARIASAGLDAAIRQARQAQAGLDAAVQREWSAQAQTDAIIARLMAATAGMDSAVRFAPAATAGLDALIQGVFSGANPGFVHRGAARRRTITGDKIRIIQGSKPTRERS